MIQLCHGLTDNNIRTDVTQQAYLVIVGYFNMIVIEELYQYHLKYIPTIFLNIVFQV